METKPWYTSKILWLGVITTLIGALEAIQIWLEVGDYSPGGIVTLVIGILMVVLRVWFTDTKLV